MRQFSHLIALFGALILVSADQLVVLRQPKAVELKGDSYLSQENVEDVLSAVLGYSVPVSEEGSSWDGLVISDPFNLAEGLVCVVVEGIESLSFSGSRSIDVIGSGDPVGVVVSNIKTHQGTAVELDLKTDVSKALETPFGTITPGPAATPEYLKPKSSKADKDFLNQLAIVDGLTKLFESYPKTLPTATVVRVSLSALQKEHEEGSKAHSEALKLLRTTLSTLATASDKAYGGRVFISALVTADHARTRRQAEPTPAADDLNIVDGYDANFPVMFNIVLWFSIIMFLTLLAISYAIGYMDPGRDSIIYRMTSTRMKKDN